MTWSEPESLMIKSLLKSVEATDKNVTEIKEAIVGSLKDGGKVGLQDTVRELGANVGMARGEIITNKAANAKDHKFIKRAVAGAGILALIALLLNFDTASPIVGGLLKLILKILT